MNQGQLCDHPHAAHRRRCEGWRCDHPGLSGTVALARSIVTRSASCLCRCMGSSTPCCATTTALLVGGGLWSSCVRLLLQDLLGCRAIPIPTGCALIVGDALEPLACATLGAGMQGGMIHREQVRPWW